MLKRIGIITIIISLAACAVSPPPITQYRLQEIALTQASSPNAQYSVLVTTPIVQDNFQSKLMYYSTEPYQIKPYAKNQWAVPPSQMLLNLLTTSLRNTQRFRAVVSPPFAGLPNFQLNTQLIHFEQVFVEDSSYFNLVVVAVLINNTTHRAIAQRRFAITMPAPENSPYGGVVAANRAAIQLSQQLSAWSVNAIFNNNVRNYSITKKSLKHSYKTTKKVRVHVIKN